MGDKTLKSIQNLSSFMSYNRIRFREKRTLFCSISSQRLTKGYEISYGEFEVFFIPNTNYPHILIDKLDETDFRHNNFSVQFQTFEFNKEENALIIKGESPIHGRYEVKLKA
jgi:hypothetical protein